MTINTIDAAILAHRAWVARFQSALRGINDEIFDIDLAADDTACTLGGWLRTVQAGNLLGHDSYDRIVALHATFHEVAGNIARQFNGHASAEEVAAWIQGLESISSQLILCLEQVKKTPEA